MDKNEEFLKQAMEKSDDVVKWVMSGLTLAKKENKTLEDMLDMFKGGWYMAALFEMFSKGGDLNGE